VTYYATSELKRLVRTVCGSCQTPYYYVGRVVGTGIGDWTGKGAASRASEEAMRASGARRAFRSPVRPVKCPNCGRTERFMFFAWAARAIWPLAIIGAGVVWFSFPNAFQFPGVLVVILGLAGGGFLLLDWLRKMLFRPRGWTDADVPDLPEAVRKL